MRNVILVDFLPPTDWALHKAVKDKTKEDWEIICLQSVQNHGSALQTFIRYLKYFLLPFRVFLHRKRYSKVLAYQQFFGLILGFYMRLFRIKTGPSISVMTLIYKPKESWVGKLYYSFVRYAINSEHIRNVFVNSENEKKYYSELFGLPETLVKTVKLGVRDERIRMESFIRDEGYYVSAGRSNRDYTFLIESWKRQSRQLRIICDVLEAGTTANVVYLKECFEDDYLKELAGCHAVIIPLEDENISSGQLVLLHAMMLGKPVIMTKNKALAEYVLNGKTSIVIDKTEQSLNEALLMLDDMQIYNSMAVAARRYLEQNYTYEQLGRSIGEVLSAQ